MATTTAHFSPKTLANLADLLLARRASAAECAEALRNDVTDALSRRDFSDLFDQNHPSVDADATTALMLVDRAERRVWEVEEALARVADGTYGNCLDCGTRIALKRLRALPAAARCVGCSRRSPGRTYESVDRDQPRPDETQGRSLAGVGASAHGEDER
ncbi:MAG: TraR/DksA C4-type zinc finger protein [Acidimicrobiia bacterium]|nr:TraR/DksA C4-type zinc finger protein [Acidimicrobiia bacterium]